MLLTSSSWAGWEPHFGTTSLRWRAIRSSSWLTRKEGGRCDTPPCGMVIRSRHIGQRNCASLAKVATILVRHSKQMVCEQGRSFGLWSTES